MKGRRQPGWRQRGGGTSASVHACLRGSGPPTSGAIAGGGFLRLSKRSGTSSRSASVWRGAVSVGWLRGDAAGMERRRSSPRRSLRDWAVKRVRGGELCSVEATGLGIGGSHKAFRANDALEREGERKCLA